MASETTSCSCTSGYCSCSIQAGGWGDCMASYRLIKNSLKCVSMQLLFFKNYIDIIISLT